jgi:small-conductance mechanosensitive channel
MNYTFQHIQDWIHRTVNGILDSIIQPETIIQFLVVLLCIGIGFAAGIAVKNVFKNKIKLSNRTYPVVRKLLEIILKQTPFIFVAILIFICLIALQQIKYPVFLLYFVEVIIATRIFIKIIKYVFLSEFWGKVFAIFLWSLVVLVLFDLLNPMSSFLDKVGFKIGIIHVTALSIFKAFLVCSILLIFGNYLSKLLEQKLDKIPELTGSTAVLLVKTAKVTIYAVIILVALHSAGIELTTLAVFGGALGVGLGFGLQKVVSNFISGIILLLDKSIKPGDVIEIGDVYGYISKLQSRYVSVVIRDGSEHLIPNEDLITQKVVNWSFSNTKIRLDVPIGISYDSDPHLAIKLVLSSIKSIPRILPEPAPSCLLQGFGDSAVDLKLRFWIRDPENGLGNIRSEVLLNVWDVFKENGIVIPFPQREVHIKQSSE